MDPGIHEQTYWLNIFENEHIFFCYIIFIWWKFRTTIRDLDMEKCNVELVTVVSMLSSLTFSFYYLIIIISYAFKMHNSLFVFLKLIKFVILFVIHWFFCLFDLIRLTVEWIWQCLKLACWLGFYSNYWTPPSSLSIFHISNISNSS